MTIEGRPKSQGTELSCTKELRQALQKEYVMFEGMHDGEMFNPNEASVVERAKRLKNLFRRGTGAKRSRSKWKRLRTTGYEAPALRGQGYECPNKDYGPRSNYMENNEEMLLMACVEEEKRNNKLDFWFLDSEGNGDASTSVFYVPGLQNNLLSSGGQLMEKGLEMLR
ncbi:hypothetical protein Tco_0800506 [Tanacetum coccineum]|uniref:Uncharacterized protein n=1 Tax=Tanacetum coccineum TaxID=301880 RepID=A0ABQ4ZTG8_9ASTR